MEISINAAEKILFDAAQKLFNDGLRGDLSIDLATALYQIDDMEALLHTLILDAIQRHELPKSNPRYLSDRKVEQIFGISRTTFKN